MNIRSESDCDVDHKPSEVLLRVCRNKICPMKDMKILFCPSRLLSTCLKGLLSNAFLLLHLAWCHTGGFIGELLQGKAGLERKGYFVSLAGINLCHLSSLIYTPSQ